ncbi:unnamed protein product, partial [Mesorhabditis belari]|uniref:Uncharacterized protein n=1 Tax=Mesorhabditis belari TaxID=2138241 RepID=A0AAF3EME0_9BILA
MSCTLEASTSHECIGKTMASASSTAVRNVVAVALIHRLHQWCVNLFWITLLCVIGCVGDEQQKCSAIQLNAQRHHKRKAMGNVEKRRSRTRDIAEIEMKLLRHLTSPQNVAMRPVHQQQRQSRKRHTGVASRPPSPQLFDIREEPEEN